ncbi:hypothetical protein ACIRRH_31370 [Kitasatospora sp. NPDC101235]|uniref:hypothetical protein n=1 Tax=Kitasatospora sp. NPDC101235 TaxID=3364101 RepID=UPI00381A4F6E
MIFMVAELLAAGRVLSDQRADRIKMPAMWSGFAAVSSRESCSVARPTVRERNLRECALLAQTLIVIGCINSGDAVFTV